MSVVFLCGFECGADTDKYTSTTAAQTFSTTRARTGQRSLRSNLTGTASYTQHTLNTAAVTSVIRFYMWWDTLPATAGTDWPIVLGNISAGTQGRIWLTSTGVLKFGYTTKVTHPTTIVTGQWYRVDMRMLNNDGTGTKKIDVQIDGVSTTQATLVEAGANVVGWRFGGPGSAVTMDWYCDDLIMDNDTTAYPIGEGQVDAIYPDGDGTHSFTAGDFGDNAGVILSSTTVAWQKIDDVPMPLSGAALTAADWLEQIVTRTTGYLEFSFDTAPITGHTIRGICIAGAVQAETASAATNEVRINDNGTVETGTTFGSATIALTTIKHIYKVVGVRPSTSTAWTVQSMDTLKARWGFSSDAAPDVRLESLLIEVEQIPKVPYVNPMPRFIAQ